MRRFAQYLENRDQKLHDQIVDEGIVGDMWKGTKDFFGEFWSRLKEQFGEFSDDAKKIKQAYSDGKLTPVQIKEINEASKKKDWMRVAKILATVGVVVFVALSVGAGHAHGGGPLDGPLVKTMPDKTGDGHDLSGIQKTIDDAKGLIHDTPKVGFIPLKSFEKLGQDDDVLSGIKWDLKNMKGSGLLKFKNALGEQGEFSKIFNHTLQKSGVKEAIKVANELSKLSKVGTSDVMEIGKILKSETSKDPTLKNSPELKELEKSLTTDVTKDSEYTKKIEDHIKKDKADSEMSAKERAKQAEKNAKNQAAYDQDAKDSAVKRQENEKIKDEILKTGSSEIINKIHDSPKSVVKFLLQSEVDNMIIKTFKEKGDEAGLQLANIISMKGGLESIKSRQQADEYGNMKFTSGPEFVKQSVKKLGSSPKTMADLDRIYKGGQDGSNERTGIEWGKKNNLPSYYEGSVTRGFAQYLEERDPGLHGRIVDEGIVGDAAKWVGDKAKVVYQGAKKKLQSAKNVVQSAKALAGEAGEALRGVTDRWAAKKQGGYEYESNPENW